MEDGERKPGKIELRLEALETLTRNKAHVKQPMPPVERFVTISHIRATPQTLAHVDEAILTSWTNPIGSTYCASQTNPHFLTQTNPKLDINILFRRNKGV